jgi:hypothetical protein
MKKNSFLVFCVLTVFVLGLVFTGCDTGNNPESDALTMSDYLKYVQPKSEDWGERLMMVYNLNPEYKDEIITVFSNENHLVIRTYSDDNRKTEWDVGQTVFRYVELRELKSGDQFCPKFIQYSASDSIDVIEYMAFDEPKLGETVEQWWDEGLMSIEYLGQTSPTSLPFTKEEHFGRWMYPGYYKRTNVEEGYYEYFHIIAERGKIAEFEHTAWQK